MKWLLILLPVLLIPASIPMSDPGGSPSDQRFKNSITPLTGALESVERLRGVKFVWDTEHQAFHRLPGRHSIGMLAQEVEKVYPELIRSWGSKGYKNLDYQGMAGVLVEAVKELNKKNEALEKRVEKLEEAFADDLLLRLEILERK